MCTEAIQTTAPISIILEGFTFQTVSDDEDLLMKNSFFLSVVVGEILME